MTPLAPWKGANLITFDLTDSILVRLRIFPSALWEALSSTVVLVRGPAPPAFPYRSWARAAAPALRRTGARALCDWVTEWPQPRIPDFLLALGTPERQQPLELSSAWAHLDRPSAEEVRRRLHRQFPSGVPPAFRRFGTDPRGALAWLKEAVAAYCDTALAPFWSAVREVVEEDVTYRAQVLATQGVDELLAGLHARIQWRRPVLCLQTDQSAAPPAPSEIVLVPLLFVRERTIVITDERGVLRVGFQCRGAANLGIAPVTGATSARDDRLALLMGRSRAAVARCLATPSTTTAIAELLDLAPSTVSEHLAVLTAARAVVRRRRANKVYYRLTDIGRNLLREFSG